MLISKVADPYASALINLASTSNTLDTITSDINDLLELFDSNENLVGYLENPLYSKSSKKAVLEKVIAPLYFNENTVPF
jgi:F-type H+-transporting ATPase subunit delta